MLHTVTIADMMMSSDEGDVLITHALGSCLGITVYDFRQRIGGMLHVMLPDSSIDPAKAAANPFMFVDTGMQQAMEAFGRAGSRKQSLIIKATGGASSKSQGEDDYFQIGRRNFIMLRKYLWDNGLVLKSHDVGGYGSRTVTLEIGSGEMSVKTNGQVKII
jgi:chemotaxis protein CheD